MSSRTWTAVFVLLTLALALSCTKKTSDTGPGQSTAPGVTKQQPELTAPPPLPEAQRKKLEAAHLEALRPFVKPIATSPAVDPAKLVTLAIATKGGLAKIKAVKTIMATHKITQAGAPDREVWVASELPDKMRAETIQKGRTLSDMLVLGQRVYIKRAGHLEPLTGVRRVHVVRMLMTDSIPFLLRASAPGAKLRYLGTTEVLGKKSHAIELALEGYVVKAYLEVASHELLGMTVFSGITFVTSLEGDFKVIDGLRFAHKTKLVVGKMVIDSTTSKMAFNKPVPGSLFKVK